MEPLNIGTVLPLQLENEMRSSYMDYAMSVIVSRALPDARDGLKPVHRRILYAMQEQGMTPGARYQKCAAIVGEVLKHYHPHGDTSVYDTLVRMAQDFSLRYPLVATTEVLMKFVRGPDSPPGGFIMGRGGIASAYGRGHGRLIVRARHT